MRYVIFLIQKGSLMPAWLFALFAAGFVLYTDDYVIAGILPELAADLGVSESHAGQLITAFSLTVGIVAAFGCSCPGKNSTTPIIYRRSMLVHSRKWSGCNCAVIPPPSGVEGDSRCGCSWDDSCRVRLRRGTGSCV